MLRPKKPAKHPTDLSLSADVPNMARELGMNTSRDELAQEVQRPSWARWNEDNKDAISSYNARTEIDGLPLARYRTFLKGR
jgi:antitoxin CcdA